MKVVIIDHARDRMMERGASEADVLAVLSQGAARDAPMGRQVKEMVFLFNASWHGRPYQQKKVRVVYIVEDDTNIVITVYAYFGKWEE